MSLARRAARLTHLLRLVLVTDAARLPDPAPAMRVLPRGAAVIFRHYEAPNREELGQRLAALAQARGLTFLVAGDPKLAARLRADGFHAPEGLVHRIAAARALMPRGLMIAAAHGAKGVIAAQQSGADAVLLSPVFATRSHPGAPALGPIRSAALAAQARLPVIALGGIDDTTARRLGGTGVAGFAAIGALAR